MRKTLRTSLSLLVPAAVIACSHPQGPAAQVQHDRTVAAILTCGGGVFEDEAASPEAAYDYSVRDGAEMLVSIGHRIGFSRLSHLLGLGDDGQWFANQFEPDSYQLKRDATRTVVSTAYLLGQYARHYCIDHPLDTLNDATDTVVRQVRQRQSASPQTPQ